MTHSSSTGAVVEVTRNMLKATGFLFVCMVSAPDFADATCTNENPLVAKSTPSEDFVIHGDGTVNHKSTGLMWMQCSLGQVWAAGACENSVTVFTWKDALQATEEVNLGGGYAGYTDWRLPDIKELESIVEQGCWAPAINLAVFPGTASSNYWSSSLFTSIAWRALAVRFASGTINFYDQDNEYMVRLVRQ